MIGCAIVACPQWRRSVVKSEGVRIIQVKPSNYRSRPKFVFGTENWLFDHFRLFPFSAEMNFDFCFIFFIFIPKMSFALGR